MSTSSWVICYNLLTITGPDSQIKKFLQDGGEGLYYGAPCFVFSNFVKQPVKGSNVKLYEWRVVNWGTKQHPDRTKYNQRFGWLEMRFQTAWAGPVPLIRKISERYKRLTFELLLYDQSGGSGLDPRKSVCHKFTFKKGKTWQADEPYDRLFWEGFME